MSISTTIRNQIKAQARRVEWRTNEYTRPNTRSNTFGYSWKLNECLLIGRANNTHKIKTQNSSYEIRKAKKKKKITERYKLFLSTLIYLFIFFLLLLLLLLLTCCCSYRKKSVMSSKKWKRCRRRVRAIVRQELDSKANKDRKPKKKNIYIQKVSTLLIKWKVFASHVILFRGLYMSGRGVWGVWVEGIFAWRNTYPMHSGHNADSYRPRGRSPC